MKLQFEANQDYKFEVIHHGRELAYELSSGATAAIKYLRTLIAPNDGKESKSAGRPHITAVQWNTFFHSKAFPGLTSACGPDVSCSCRNCTHTRNLGESDKRVRHTAQTSADW